MGGKSLVFYGAVIGEQVIGGKVGLADGLVDEDYKATPTCPTGRMPGVKRVVGDVRGLEARDSLVFQGAATRTKWVERRSASSTAQC